MEIHTGRVTVVNDAYNANPDSTTAALETVATMPGRHIAVLGRMHELGKVEAASHREVGEEARRLGFSAVVVVGDDPGIADGAGQVGVKVSYDDVLLWNGWIELVDDWLPQWRKQNKEKGPQPERHGHCSAFIATGSYTGTTR